MRRYNDHPFYVSKRQRICWISFLSVCLVMRELCVWGIRSMRYWGAFFTMSCNRVNLCMFRLVCRVAHPVSRYSNVCEVCLFAPVTICAARICRFSSCDFNCLVELSKTTSLYSNTGLINDMYIISSVYRGSLYFNESIIFIRLEDVAHICSTWTDHVNLLSIQRHILQYSALKKYRHGHSWTISFGYQHGYRFLNAHLYKPLLGPFLDYQEVIINIIHGRNDVALLNNSE